MWSLPKVCPRSSAYPTIEMQAMYIHIWWLDTFQYNIGSMESSKLDNWLPVVARSYAKIRGTPGVQVVDPAQKLHETQPRVRLAVWALCQHSIEQFPPHQQLQNEEHLRHTAKGLSRRSHRVLSSYIEGFLQKLWRIRACMHDCECRIYFLF